MHEGPTENRHGELGSLNIIIIIIIIIVIIKRTKVILA